MPRMTRLVVCGLSLVIATLAPTRALVSVDLPTFGRPKRQAKPERKVGLVGSVGLGLVGLVGLAGLAGLAGGGGRRARGMAAGRAGGGAASGRRLGHHLILAHELGGITTARSG